MHFGILMSTRTAQSGRGFEKLDITQAVMDPRKRLGMKRGTWRLTQTQDIGPDTDFCYKWERTYAALLDKEQFLKTAEFYGFSGCSLCDTCGALGMPGAEPWYAMMPAWSLDSEGFNQQVNIYVTPYPDVKIKTQASCTDKNVRKMRNWLRQL